MKDWIGSSEELLDKLRPKVRLDQAIIIAAVALGLCGVWAAHKLRDQHPAFDMVQQGDVVFVLNRYSGEVMACRYEGGNTICTEADSARKAGFRALLKAPE